MLVAVQDDLSMSNVSGGQEQGRLLLGLTEQTLKPPGGHLPHRCCALGVTALIPAAGLPQQPCSNGFSLMPSHCQRLTG